MRKFGWAPSIVPNGDDQNVYLVVDDLGRFGRVWREAEVDHPDLETVIEDLLAGEYSNPIGVFGFNILEGRSWMFRPTSLTNCDGATTCSGRTFRRPSRTSLSAMRTAAAGN
jgi:hypothetical protein